MRLFGWRRDVATAHLWDYAGCRPLAFKGRILSYLDIIGRRATPHLHEKRSELA
jgi:hypothetical protein